MRSARFLGVFLVSSAFASFAFSSEGGGKRAFEIGDYYRTNMVGAPTVSADGSMVAFPVTRYELEAGESWSEIWMMEADGSGLRQMTCGRRCTDHGCAVVVGDLERAFAPIVRCSC